jgi:hypothetical protein
LPELAVALTLATTMLFFGASLFAADANGGDARAESGAVETMEMRSAAPNAAPVPIRQDVRIIPFDGLAVEAANS